MPSATNRERGWMREAFAADPPIRAIGRGGMSSRICVRIMGEVQFTYDSPPGNGADQVEAHWSVGRTAMVLVPIKAASSSGATVACSIGSSLTAIPPLLSTCSSGPPRMHRGISAPRNGRITHDVR
jgi:hypothetical protein